MHVVERITGVSGVYAFTGTVSRDGNHRYVARAAPCRLTLGVAQASGPDITASGATAPEARTRLCLELTQRLGSPVTRFAWRPIVVLVAQ
jgi:hypothetical protein